MTKSNSINEQTNEREVELLILKTLFKRGRVVIPDFGHLEVKSFGERKTVLLKSLESNDSFVQIMAAADENDKKDLNTLYKAISLPLKEENIVNLPQVGVFRPVKRENGKIYLSFIPAFILIRLLNKENEEVADNEGVEKEFNNNSQIKSIFNSSNSDYDEQKDQSENNILSIAENDRGFNKKESMKNYEIQQTKYDSKQNEKKTKAIDIVVKQDDKVVVKKSRNFTGTLLLIVAVVALIIIIATNIITNRTKKAEDEVQLFFPNESSSLSLTSLAVEHYGHPAFWVYIYEANIDKLKSPINIPDDADLLIPDLKEDFGVISVTDSLEIQRANILANIFLNTKKSTEDKK